MRCALLAACIGSGGRAVLVPESKTSLPWVRVVGVFDVLVSEPRPSLLWVRVVGVFDVLVLELKRSLLWVW